MLSKLALIIFFHGFLFISEELLLVDIISALTGAFQKVQITKFVQAISAFYSVWLAQNYKNDKHVTPVYHFC
jgi:hypothetical protein